MSTLNLWKLFCSKKTCKWLVEAVQYLQEQNTSWDWGPTPHQRSMLYVCNSWAWSAWRKEHNQLSPLKPSLLETREFRTLSTPSLSNWLKIEPALTPTLLSLWPPEIGTHSQPPSSLRLITFSCLRPTSTDTFNSYPAHKSPLLPFFTMKGPTQAFRGCTFLVYLLLWSISLKKK